MTTIRTSEELDALAPKQSITDHYGDEWNKLNSGEWCSLDGERHSSVDLVDREYGPFEPVPGDQPVTPGAGPTLESVRREALLEYVREARKNPGSAVWDAEDVFADIEDWATHVGDDQPATGPACVLPSAQEALADLSTVYNAESGSREKDTAFDRLVALLSPATAALAGRQPTVAELADELEYRVRTAVALAKGGHDIDEEVRAGRERITALAVELGRQPVKAGTEWGVRLPSGTVAPCSSEAKARDLHEMDPDRYTLVCSDCDWREVQA